MTSASCMGQRLSKKVDYEKIKQFVRQEIQDDFLMMWFFFVPYIKNNYT